MKRYASHYLLWPGVGYLKQFAIEVEDGYVVRIYPCMEERESVEWHPGVLLLAAEKETGAKEPSFFHHPVISPEELPNQARSLLAGEKRKAVLLYPFDFTSLQPVGETRHTPLP
ncbi:MAG: hypothetical protein LUF04_05095 [Bacteroides sp.]|nr:hypothetical protein [Bacteroides sp.]